MEFLGEKKLRENCGTIKPAKVEKISDKVYFLNNFGGSNAILLVGNTSCVLVDAFECDYDAKEAKKAIEAITDKPIKTVILTHQHPDHTGGGGVFEDTVERVIAHIPATTPYGKSELMIQNTLLRMSHQFGQKLTVEESVSSGLAAARVMPGKAMPLKVTEYIGNKHTEMEIDGIKIQLIEAVGETDDQQFVWLPEEKVLCCGDDYYASWPNLSAIRGGQYRDVCLWIDSLERLLELKPQTLLPGHGTMLSTEKEVQEIIGAYREGLNYVLEETLKGINRGLTPDELALEIKLPPHLAQLPQLQEYYGTVEWSVRGIYSGYVGWYDGNPTHLGTMDVKEKAEKTIRMMGGSRVVLNEIEEALQIEEMQWAMELCDILLRAQVDVESAKKYKRQAMIYLGRMQSSANGRHYYLSCAKDYE